MNNAPIDQKFDFEYAQREFRNRALNQEEAEAKTKGVEPDLAENKLHNMRAFMIEINAMCADMNQHVWFECQDDPDHQSMIVYVRRGDHSFQWSEAGFLLVRHQSSSLINR